MSRELAEAVVVTTVSSIFLLGVEHWRQRNERHLSSDGDRYFLMGRGVAVPYPFMWRWLIPAMCRASPRRWSICTNLHLAALPVLTTVYITHWPVRCSAATVGGLLVCGMAGIWRNNVRRPVLVDAPALCWALAAAVCSVNGLRPFGLAVALMAACMKETAPIFAACFALDPLLLLALIAPAARRLMWQAGRDSHNSTALADPFRAARRAHADHCLDPAVMVAPWGMGILALGVQQPSVAVTVLAAGVVAYAQLFVAVNTVRLYQWAGPAVALGVASVLPPGWELPVLALHLLNPLAGDGR